MTNIERAAEIRGKTIRFVWSEGPTKGMTHEHVFHQDGTVTWSDAGQLKKEQSAGSSPGPKEKPQYAAVRVADQIYAVSYLASSGYALTVVLNFADRRLVGFASSAKDWHPVGGTFQVVK